MFQKRINIYTHPTKHVPIKFRQGVVTPNTGAITMPPVTLESSFIFLICFCNQTLYILDHESIKSYNFFNKFW